MKKYTEQDKERLLKVTTCFTANEEADIIKIWRQEYGLDIKRFYVDVNSRIDAEALELFGTKILKDSLSNNVNYYQLLIPSTAVKDIWHAVAFMIDHKQKVMRYHDSHGVDMRPEMKDFLVKLFPGYRIMINHSKQQEDVVSNNHQEGKNDNSCGLLSLYNLRDMWFEQNGQPDKVCDFNSLDARQDVWKILETIVTEQKQTVEANPVLKSTFSFGKAKIPTIEERQKQIQENQKQIQENFEYRLYKEPNYKELIDMAVKNARANFEIYRDAKIFLQGGNSRI